MGPRARTTPTGGVIGGDDPDTERRRAELQDGWFSLRQDVVMDYDALADLARPALIIAAMRRTTVTYGELARSIGVDTSIPLSHHMKRVLDRVSDRCFQAGEPSLAVLVVNADSGEPGPGFVQGSLTWASGTRECFKRWSPA